jgi:hypothetical protein
LRIPIQIITLFLCIAGELLMLTETRNAFGPFVSPIIHFACSIGVGISVLMLRIPGTAALTSQTQVSEPEKQSLFQRYRYLVFAIPFIAALAFILQSLFAAHPIDINDPYKSGSDVIPALMFYAKRFLAGEFPYTPIQGTHWHHIVIPNYLTFQWLPYCIAEAAGFDYRWIPFVFLTAALLVLYFRLGSNEIAQPARLTLFLFPILILFFWMRNHAPQFQTTVEGLIAAYYLFFAYSLNSKRIGIIALMLTICLLSRFSLVLWVPLLLLILLHERGIKTSFLTGVLTLAGIALFYGSFLLIDPTIFSKGMGYYTVAAAGEWIIHDWHNGRYPYVLEQGLGFAIYFYDLPISIPAKIDKVRQLHLSMSLLSVAVLCAIYWYQRKKIDYRVFAIASFKIYLAVFYAFIQVPYVYLHLVPLMIDIPLLYIVFRSLYPNPNKFQQLK